MTVEYKIKDEKLQYNIDREAAKISVLSCGIVKYEYLTGEETLPPDQRRVIQQVKFPHSPLGKAYENQITWRTWRALEEHGKQLVKYKNEKESSMHSK